jgi:hypothetical protein
MRVPTYQLAHIRLVLRSTKEGKYIEERTNAVGEQLRVAFDQDEHPSETQTQTQTETVTVTVPGQREGTKTRDRQETDKRQ